MKKILYIIIAVLVITNTATVITLTNCSNGNSKLRNKLNVYMTYYNKAETLFDEIEDYNEAMFDTDKAEDYLQARDKVKDIK